MVAVSDDLLAPLAGRIVELTRPRPVILFGSQARGTAGKGSDLDFLIVRDRLEVEPWSRRREIGRIRRGLPSVGLPIDLLLYTPEEVERWRHTTNHVVSEALREGRILYERP
jgi:predicted nucleotidyltransferase